MDEQWHVLTGPLLYGPLTVLRQFNVHRCSHKSTLPAAKCIMHACRVTSSDRSRFFIATQVSVISHVIHFVCAMSSVTDLFNLPRFALSNGASCSSTHYVARLFNLSCFALLSGASCDSTHYVTRLFNLPYITLPSCASCNSTHYVARLFNLPYITLPSCASCNSTHYVARLFNLPCFALLSGASCDSTHYVTRLFNLSCFALSSSASCNSANPHCVTCFTLSIQLHHRYPRSTFHCHFKLSSLRGQNTLYSLLSPV